MPPKTKKTQKKRKTGNANSTTPTVTAVGKALRSLGAIGGNTLGSFAGMGTLGSTVGTELGAALSRWLGYGDYTVRSNSIVSQMKSSGSIPNMHRNGQSVVIRHKEYIMDVTSSTGFSSLATFALNPGLAASFPWLSSVAQQYQEYTWRGIVYHFIPTSGSAVSSTNNALGTVMLATQYKATASNFTNKTALLNEYFSSDARPCDAFVHPIECDPKENPYNVQYVRGSAVPSGEDQKTYDLGVVTLATEGMQAASIDVGELWVSYEVELRKPVVSGLSGVFNLSAHYYSTTGVSTAAGFGTLGAIVKQFDAFPNSLTFTATKLTFPIGTVGTFLIGIAYHGVTAGDIHTWVSSGTLTNMTFKSYTLGSSAPNGSVATYSVGTASCMAFGFFNIADPTLVASFIPNLTTLTGTDGVDVYVAQVASGTY